MQSNNGDIELSVTLDTKGIKSDAKKIKEEIEKEVSKTSVTVERIKNNSGDAKTEKEIDKLYEKRLDLTSKIAVAERESNTERLKELQQQRSEIDKQISQLEKAGKIELVDDEESKRIDEILKRKREREEKESSTVEGTTSLEELYKQLGVTQEEVDARNQKIEDDTRQFWDEIGNKQKSVAEEQATITDNTVDYATALKDAKTTAQSLATDLQAFSEGKMYSEDFKYVQEDVGILSKNLDSTNKKMREMEALGQTDSEKYQELVNEANELASKLNEANKELARMRGSGEAYTEGTNAEELAGVQKQYDTITNKMALMKKGAEGTSKSLTDVNRIAALLPGRLGTSIGKITRATQSLARFSIKDMINDVKNMSSEIAELATTSLSTAGAVSSSIAIIVGAVILRVTQAIKEAKAGLAQLTKILKRGLQIALRGISGSVGFLWNTFLKLGRLIGGSLVQGVRSLISRLMSLKGAIMENINLMAKWNNGNNAVNKAMSDLTSSLAYLKASLATAFAPILTTIEPILDSLINKLAEVITMIGMFIAKITGATTFQKAIRKQKDYAKSLKGVGGAAKEASESLADYDKLQVIQSKDSGGGAGDMAADFEEVGLEAVDLSKLLDDLVAKAYDWGHALGTNLKNFLDSIPWATIQENVNKAAKAIANFINGFVEVEGLAKSIGHTVGEAINTLIGFVNTFLTETHWDSVGKFIGEALMEAIRTIHWDELGQMFANLLNATFELVHYFTEIFDGKELGEKLSEMLTNFTQNLNWEEIQSAVTGVVEDLVGILNGLVTPETFAEVGTTLGKTIQTILMGIGTAIDTAEWEQWGESLKTGIINMLSEIKFDEAGQSVSNLTKGLLTLIEGAVDGLLSTGADGKNIGDRLLEFIENIDWEGISTQAVSISQKLSTALETIFDELQNSEAYDKIIDAIVDFLNEKKNWERLFKRFKNSIIRDVVVEMVWGETKELFTLSAESFDEAEKAWKENDWGAFGVAVIQGIATGLTGVLDIIAEPINGLFESVWNALLDAFGMSDAEGEAIKTKAIGTGIVTGISAGFSGFDIISFINEWWTTTVYTTIFDKLFPEFGESVDTTIENFKSDLVLKFQELGEKLSETWTSIKESGIEAFVALKDGIKEPINGILSMVEKFINAVVSGLNGLIGKLNTVKIDVPDWAKKIPGVGSLSFNVPTLNEVKIPRLAQGAVIPPNKEFLAMLGDQKSGTNIETPLDTMMDAFRQVLTEFEGVSGSKEPIILQLNGKTVAQVVWDEERKKYKQTSSYQY